MEITKETIEKIHKLLDSGLSNGLGTPEAGQMCVEAAICYALDLPHGDNPGCVIEPLRRLKIKLNDSSLWTSNKTRAEGLRRLAIAQLGSKGTVNPVEFSTRVARMTIQTIIPTLFRSLAKKLTGEHPANLLTIALKCEKDPSKENAAAAAAYADAANADADADAAAYAAAYAADAAAAAAYAAHAAYAAAYAARQAEREWQYRRLCKWLNRELTLP